MVTLVLLIAGKKPTKTAIGWCFHLGADYWGGCDLCLMHIRDQKSVASLDWHEMGHSFQNALLGPLFPFVVAIPSAIRWNYLNLKYWRKGQDGPDYDRIWFEGAATVAGTVLFAPGGYDDTLKGKTHD